MKRIRIIFIFFVALTLKLFSQPSTPQTSGGDSLRIYLLPELLVTATRSEKDAFQVPRSVGVINAKQLHDFLYNSAAEALSQQEGIYIVGTGQNPGMIQSIFTRGANSNHTTILIDDIRITDPSAVNNAPDIAELSLANAEQIEVVRGSHGTLYGSSAIGGVVNIITKKNLSAGLHGDLELKSGTFGKGTSTFSENVFLNYTTPLGLYFNATVGNSNTNGLDATVDTVTNPNAFKNRDQDRFDKRDLIGKIGFNDQRWDLYVSYGNTKHKIDIDKSANIDDDNAVIDFKRNLYTYGASYNFDEMFKLKYVGGYSTMERYVVDDSSVVDKAGNNDHTYSDATYKGAISNNELLGSLRIPGFDLVVGGGLYGETMGSKSYFYTSSFGGFEFKSDLDTLNLKTTTTSFFAHGDLQGRLAGKTLEQFSLAFGARFNKHNIYGTHWTFEVAPSFRISENAMVYASYSTGFNTPSLYQLFAPSENFTSGITRGNNNLQPETSVSYEVGLKHRLSNGWMFSFAYFNTVVDNAIEYVYLWNKDRPVDSLGYLDDRGDTYLNVGKQTTSGVELGVLAQLAEGLSFIGNASLVSGTLSYQPSNIDGAQTKGNHVQVYSNGAFINREVESVGLIRRPNTASASLLFNPSNRFLTRVDIRYVGPRPDIYYNSNLGPYGALGTVSVEKYTLVDLSAKFLLSEYLSVQARLENMFDTRYAEINGFTTRGRGFYFNIRYLFDQQLY